MKKLQLTLILLLGLQAALAATPDHEAGSEATVRDGRTVSLRVPNFIRPLAERWAADYGKAQQVEFQFVTGRQAQDATAAITVVTDDAEAVSVARYAVLPVTARASKAAGLLGQRRLNAKKLKALFFSSDENDDDAQEADDATQPFHIYTGNSQQSVSRFYAAHFKQEVTDYKGKKISGDDSFLTTALSRDPLGVTVNTLPNIFSLESRQLRQDVSLLPLDIDRQSRQTLDDGRLDEIIQLLETQQFSEIPVGRVSLVYDHSNPLLSDFVHWVLTQGVQYVHNYGLLQLPEKELTAQLRRVSQQELAQK